MVVLVAMLSLDCGGGVGSYAVTCIASCRTRLLICDTSPVFSNPAVVLIVLHDKSE